MHHFDDATCLVILLLMVRPLPTALTWSNSAASIMQGTSLSLQQVKVDILHLDDICKVKARV